MPTGLDGIFGIYEKAYDVRSKRAEIIANNIANVDTPGYQARDLDFREILGRQMDFNSITEGMSATNENHVSSFLNPSTLDGLKFRTRLQASLDGNSVDAQVEKTKYAENALRLQATFNFLNGRVKSIRGALRGD